MSPFAKLILGVMLGLVLSLVDGFLAWWILGWLMLSFWQWFQIALVVHGLVGSSLILHDFRNGN